MWYIEYLVPNDAVRDMLYSKILLELISLSIYTIERNRQIR